MQADQIQWIVLVERAKQQQRGSEAALRAELEEQRQMSRKLQADLKVAQAQLRATHDARAAPVEKRFAPQPAAVRADAYPYRHAVVHCRPPLWPSPSSTGRFLVPRS
jgi:hypothetical protein